MAKETRTILVERTAGRYQRIEGIPKDAKITFSSVNPAAGRGFTHEGYCLRIYTSRENQLAVVTDVVSFRDLDLRFYDRKVKTEGDTITVRGPNGETHQEYLGKSYEWEELKV